MSKTSKPKVLPAYKEYDTFLKNSGSSKNIKDYKYYLNRYSFFKKMISLIPGVIYLQNFETQQYLFISEGSASITGYTNTEMMALGREYILSRIHPEDMETYASSHFKRFIEFIENLSASEIKKCRFSVNYRFKRKDGEYIKVLQQYVILEVNEAGYPLLSLGILTDITLHKTDDKMIFSTAFYDKKKGFEVISTESYPQEQLAITKREYEVIRFIRQGLSSKQIADKMYLSGHTVNAHRRNILRKTGCKNSAELIAYSIHHNLIH